MYVILVYDVNAKRTGKMLKLCRKYLHWIQNSVFEGQIRDSQLERLIMEARGIMEEEDSLIIFEGQSQKNLNKRIIGKERASTDNLL